MEIRKSDLLLVPALTVLLLSACTGNGLRPSRPAPDAGQEQPQAPGTEELPEGKEKTLFTAGVRLEDGWKDTDKRGVPEDIMACWLITASNMIEWWQDRHVGSGATLPAGTPYGPGQGIYGSAVFETALGSFTGLEKGGNISTGLAWYIEGTDGMSVSDNHSQPVPETGRFLTAIPAEAREYSRKPFLSYGAWENADSEEVALLDFSASLARKLETGAALGMDIKTHVGLGGALHAITLWGAGFAPDGKVSRLYITDSDDYEHRLVETPVSSMTDVYGTRVITMQISPCNAYPEGATWEVLRLFFLTDPAGHSRHQ